MGIHDESTGVPGSGVPSVSRKGLRQGRRIRPQTNDMRLAGTSHSILVDRGIVAPSLALREVQNH